MTLELLFSPSTASYCKRRLALLYHNAYVDRIYVPSFNTFGTTKAIYVLAAKGASIVARDRKPQPPDAQAPSGRRCAR